MKGDDIRVETVMRRDMLFVDGLSSVGDGLRLMRQNKVSSLVIEKRDEGDEYGFLTVNEIATQVLAQNRPLERTAVYEIMEKPILTVAPKMRVKYAVRLLARLGRRRALVENDSGLLGFVSLRDLVLSYADALSE
ncbi:MAG: CBS domain-containing protein [Rhodobacterales bacterium]|nr:MAG: CBS domain-containing protein [Rhodobacterales bacterium]